MKYYSNIILILFCLFIASCNKVDVNKGLVKNSQENGEIDLNPAIVPKPANGFSSSVDLSDLNLEKLREWKNLYLSANPILSSINVEDIQLDLNLNLSTGGNELDTYNGNLSFKFQSNDQELVIDNAYTGQDPEETQYNYVYTYDNSEGNLRYAWKAFFESKYGAFLVVLKEGVVGENNKVIFSMSEGNLYYRHWGRTGALGKAVELGDNPKCWLKQGDQYSVQDLKWDFFDCRTWRTSFDIGGLYRGGVDITRSLEPDEFYEYKYRDMIIKTIDRNFNHQFYPLPQISIIHTWTNGNNASVIGALIENRNKSYEEIHDALSGFPLIGGDFRSLISAIPIKLAGKSLSQFQSSAIDSIYLKLFNRDLRAFRDWDSIEDQDEWKAISKSRLKKGLQGTEYDDNSFGIGEGENHEKFSNAEKLGKVNLSLKQRKLPLWETSYIKLASFSGGEIAFDLNRVPVSASLNTQKSENRRSFSSASNKKRNLASVQSQKKLTLFYPAIIVSLGLLLLVLLGFIMRKKIRQSR